MIEINYDDNPDDIIYKINIKLNSYNLIIDIVDEDDDFDDGIMTYRLRKLK